MSQSLLNFSYILLQLFVLQFSSRISAIRKDVMFQDVMFQDVMFQDMYVCRNTVQGRYQLSDDNGFICDAMSLDPQSRCCPEKGEKYTCHGCNLLSQCCNSYEVCVSCCLNPVRTQKEQITKVKVGTPVTAGTFTSVFDFCAGTCRHNSKSVVHENAYASDFHHCFSLPSNTSEADTSGVEPRLLGINVIIGRQGDSCDTACKSNGQSCVFNRLAILNTCHNIQRYMSCNGTCSESMGSDQPAQVVSDAPKDSNPGACLYTQTAMLTCDGSHMYTKRLCPCA